MCRSYSCAGPIPASHCVGVTEKGKKKKGGNLHRIGSKSQSCRLDQHRILQHAACTHMTLSQLCRGCPVVDLDASSPVSRELFPSWASREDVLGAHREMQAADREKEDAAGSRAVHSHTQTRTRTHTQTSTEAVWAWACVTCREIC